MPIPETLENSIDEFDGCHSVRNKLSSEEIALVAMAMSKMKEPPGQPQSNVRMQTAVSKQRLLSNHSTYQKKEVTISPFWEPNSLSHSHHPSSTLKWGKPGAQSLPLVAFGNRDLFPEAILDWVGSR